MKTHLNQNEWDLLGTILAIRILEYKAWVINNDIDVVYLHAG